jgi:type IV secretion system protein TrbG
MHWLWLLVLLLCWGCEKKEEVPVVPPPPEDLSTWTVPELVQPERHTPRADVARPAKIPAGPAEKVYDYKLGVSVEVPVAIGAPLDIVLEPGEKVRQIVDGDRTPAAEGQKRRWEVHEGGDGPGETLRPHVFVTVSEPGLTNGLVITTTRRTYYIMCKSVNKSPTRVLRWHYPEDGSDLPRPLPDGTPAAPGLLPHPEQPMRYHVGYTLKSSRDNIHFFPRHIVDDGKKTFIVYPEVSLFERVPTLRLLGPNGPLLTNVRQYLNVLIVDELIARAELRYGTGEHADIVTIERGTLRTIECPGSSECPVWPRAASVLTRSTP